MLAIPAKVRRPHAAATLPTVSPSPSCSSSAHGPIAHHRHPLPQSPDRGGFAQDTLTLTKRLDWEASLYKYIKRKYSAEEAEQHRISSVPIQSFRRTRVSFRTRVGGIVQRRQELG